MAMAPIVDVIVFVLVSAIALPIVSRATRRIVTERFNEKRDQILSHFGISDFTCDSCSARHIVARNLHIGIIYTIVCLILTPLFAIFLLVRVIAGYNPIWYKTRDGVLVLIDSQVFFGPYGCKDDMISSVGEVIVRERGLLARTHLAVSENPQLGVFVIPGRVPSGSFRLK